MTNTVDEIISYYKEGLTKGLEVYHQLVNDQGLEYARNYLNQRRERLLELYRSLTLEEVEQLAEYAFELLDIKETRRVFLFFKSKDRKYERTAKSIFRYLACISSGVKNKVHKELVMRDIFSPGVIYLGASPEISSQLLVRQPRNHLWRWLLALAWIGDKNVQQQFLSWRENTPSWSKNIAYSPDHFSREAGWYLTHEGERENLFHAECYSLEKLEDEEQDKKSTVAFGETTDALCPSCDRDAYTFFDIDLSHPSLKFLGIKGTRLKILGCIYCYEPLFTEVDWGGAASWSRKNKPKTSMLIDEDWGLQPSNSYIISEKPRGAYEAASQFVEIPYSQIGGHPTWIQSAKYPSCPECSQPMHFIAQIHEGFGWEGIFYAFLCKGCRVACTLYQQG